MNTLEKVQKSLTHFSKSERKVAEVILSSPQTAIHSSIATLAKMADVSEPTVNRFQQYIAYRQHLLSDPLLRML